MDIIKKKNGAGGYSFSITTDKGNTRLGEAKKTQIIKALQDSYTEGVYLTSKGNIKRQLLNGNAEFLVLNRDENKYFFY
jgi:hypothetical protein